MYSYQTEQEIHFDALTDASLFGIFGAVGSGKSSILEAITFALYGDTERLNRSGDDRTYNMMNLRSDELLIDFECEAGKDAGLYRFTVKGRRNTKNFKDVKTFERKAYRWSEGAWAPLPDDENAEQIIGLSYDNFRRTIIIPQGRFQEFIELKDAERTRMMKELFQLEKYDLSRKVGTLSKQNDLELSNLDGQLMSLGEVTAEMLQSEELKREEVRKLINVVGEELAVQTELENQFQKLKLAAEKLQALKIQFDALEAQQPAMDLRAEWLRTFEICSVHFKSLLDRKKAQVVTISRDEQSLLKHAQRITELDVLLEKEKGILTELHPRYEKREELLDTAEELEKVIQIMDLRASLIKNRSALTRGELNLKEKEIEIEKIKKDKQEKEEENEKKKSEQGDIQEISQIKVWFTTTDSLIENRTRVKKEADDLAAEIKSQQGLFQQQIAEAERLFSLVIDPAVDLGGLQAIVDNYVITNQKEVENLNAQLLATATRQALQKYAVNLTDGEPCPLCGSAHHPSVLHTDDTLSSELADIENQRITLQKREQEVRQFFTPIERIFNQLDNLEKQKGAIRQRWLEVKSRLEEHEAQFVWTKFDKTNRESFDLHFESVVKNQAAIKENEQVIRNMSLRVEAEILEKTEKIEKPLQVLRDEILKLENTDQTLVHQLRNITIGDFDGEEKGSIVGKIEQLRKQYRDLIQLYEKAEKDFALFEKEKMTISGSQETLLAALQINREELGKVQSDIEEQLQSYQFESEEWVSQILAKPVDISAERIRLEEFKTTLNNLRRDLETLQSEGEGQSYDADNHELVLNKKNTLTDELNQKRKEEGRLDGLLTKMAADITRKTMLEKEKGKLLIRKDHLDDLARLFRSSGFVDYASSIYLQNLIHAANERFHQMTHQQLHLELGEGNSFWVRDLLNGGHMRLLKTLSGGQKFQAALSLALALADHIHVRNESKHNFFFLDEGFGSLDKNALQTVFETLKSLRKENRIVGIISHVEDLQQEIQTYLTIKESEEGSRITASWK